VCAIVFRELFEVANEIGHHRERLADFNLKLERRIKMFFILPTLLLRKLKGDGKLLSDQLPTDFAFVTGICEQKNGNRSWY